MTIGRSSRKGSIRSSIRAPKFLDKSSGFYDRLDEPEITTEGEEVSCNREWGDLSSSPPRSEVHSSLDDERDEAEMFDFTAGMLEDDGETLLRRKPSRRSSRWRRSSRRKQKEGRDEDDMGREERPSQASEDAVPEVEIEKMKKSEEESEKMGRGREPAVVHFPVREDEDDQVLIRDKKRGREEEEEEEEEERKIRREKEEAMKVVKRKNYRKVLDRAFRRGWEAFVHNLYSVTLTPMTSSSHSSSSPSTKKKLDHRSVLAEFR